jgi:hypothetical protein
MIFIYAAPLVRKIGIANLSAGWQVPFTNFKPVFTLVKTHETMNT